MFLIFIENLIDLFISEKSSQILTHMILTEGLEELIMKNIYKENDIRKTNSKSQITVLVF